MGVQFVKRYGELTEESLWILAMTFPSHQTAFDISPLVNDFTLMDKGGRTAYFNSSIVRVCWF